MSNVVNRTAKPYVDNGWPALPDGEHAVSELAASRAGGLSPFGEDTVFPVPVESLPYRHPVTVINKHKP